MPVRRTALSIIDRFTAGQANLLKKTGDRPRLFSASSLARIGGGRELFFFDDHRGWNVFV
jgi:hypothetical protein